MHDPYGRMVDGDTRGMSWVVIVSILFLKILILEYVVMGIVCAAERRWSSVIYWVGAVILNIGILKGMK